MTLKDMPGTEPDVTYSYDLLGQPTGAQRSWMSVGYTYDALGRLASESEGGSTISNAYDAAGRRTQMTFRGATTDYTYLMTGEMKTIAENGAVRAAYGYDDLGRRTLRAYANGTSSSYQYDGAGRLSQLNLDFAGSTFDQQVTFAYNPAGQIVERTASNTLYAFTPQTGSTGSSANGLNELVQWAGRL